MKAQHQNNNIKMGGFVLSLAYAGAQAKTNKE